MMQVWMTPDIAQHGKPLAFGPASHMDTQANAEGASILSNFINTILDGLRNDTLPPYWSAQVKDLTQRKYAGLMMKNPKLSFAPGGICTDLAKAQPKGIALTIPSVLGRMTDCYAHTWRAIFDRKNLAKLRNSSEECVNKAYECIALIAEVRDKKLLYEAILDDETDEPTGLYIDGPIYTLFKKMWAHEPEWLAYLEEYHLYNSWMRCCHPPGEVRDTNTTERFNLELKSPEHLATVEGAVTLLENSTVTCTRISRAQVRHVHTSSLTHSATQQHNTRTHTPTGPACFRPGP